MSYRENIDRIITFLRLLESFVPFNRMGALSHLITLGLGVYTGIYVAQNYEITKVDDPNVVIDKVKKYLEDMMKPKS